MTEPARSDETSASAATVPRSYTLPASPSSDTPARFASNALRSLGMGLLGSSIIDADGGLLAIAAPTDDGDAALRRALALAPATWAGVEITGALLDRKLAGQRSVLAALGIAGSTAAAFVSDHEERMSAAVSDPQTDPLGPAATLATMRLIEAGAAQRYIGQPSPRCRFRSCVMLAEASPNTGE